MDKPRNNNAPPGNETMDAPLPIKQLTEPEALPRGPGCLPDWSPLPWPTGQEKTMAMAGWSPLLDICESEAEYLLQAELPGVKKSHVNIKAEANMLTITGQREYGDEATSHKRVRAERTYGSFGCRFSLPADVNPAKVSTDFLDGVLTVRLTKMVKTTTPPEEVVDDITAWWQKTLGKKSVLGQASNRPPSGTRAPAPILLWTKPASDHAQQENNSSEAVLTVSDRKGPNNPEIRQRKGHLWKNINLTTLGQIREWSEVMIRGTASFFAILLLRLFGAVLLTIFAAVAILTAGFRRMRRWLHNVGNNPVCYESKNLEVALHKYQQIR